MEALDAPFFEKRPADPVRALDFAVRMVGVHTIATFAQILLDVLHRGV